MSKTMNLFLGIILWITSALAGVIRVPTGQPTIQAGINAADDGDTVVVAEGTYYENINFQGKPITVASHFLLDGDTTHINQTIINGSRPTDPNKGSVVSFTSGEDTTSVICGFTITRGSGTYYADYTARAGGGIYCFNSGCKAVANKIINNSVTGNSALGGGLAAIPFGSDAYVVLKDNQITHNTATANSIQGLGGGVVLYCHAQIDCNLIYHNTCISKAGSNSSYSMGGGISCISQSPYTREIIMENNTITHNSIYNDNVPSNQLRAGGVLITGYNGRMTRNQISQNEIWNYSNLTAGSAGVNVGACPDSFRIESNIIRNNEYKHGTGDCYGGGLHLHGPGSSLYVMNNIISGNSATIGGGVVNSVNTAHGGRVVFVNNTIINNIASSGGGIYFHDTNAYLMNTIIWGNLATTNAAIHSLTSTIYVAYSDVQGGRIGSGNIKSDPLFVTESAQLSETSPCIGAGTTSFNFGDVTLFAPDADILGNNRPSPSNSRPDIGAFEHERGFPKRTNFIEIPIDYPTIQAGINAADDGDTVVVAEGTYYENINFQGKPITVASHFLLDGDTTHINQTIINGSRPTDPNKGSVVSFTSGEDTTSVIYGFTITGGTGTIYDATTRVGGGIYCKTSGARIIHNKIVFNTVNHTSSSDGGGIGFWPRTNAGARYLIIEDNVIESNSITSSNGQSYIQGGGIHITKGRVTGNTIRHNSVGGQPIFAGGGGIAAGSEDTATRTLVVITGNTITHNQAITPGYYGGWGGGIDVVFCNVQIINNTISHNETGGTSGTGAGIRLWKSKDISFIKENTLCFNTISPQGFGGGIALVETQGVQVIGNRIEGNGGVLKGWGAGGIDEYGSGNLIKGNFIKGNIGRLGGGIFSWNATVINNIIVENKARIGGGICCWQYAPVTTLNLTQIINNTITGNVADTAGGIATHITNAVVLNTICWGNTAPHGPEIELWGGTLNAAYSDIRLGANGIAIDSAATVNWLAGNFDSDPQLNDSSNLLDSSPCIGAGTVSYDFGGGVTCGCPESDFAGNIRPNPAESDPDIGALESPLKEPRDVGMPAIPANALPKTYSLAQNFPNPFNPETRIEFALPKAAFVTLKIYNLLGEEVATLVAEKLPAGMHQFTWDATRLASGVYLYRLEAGVFAQTKKLILLY